VDLVTILVAAMLCSASYCLGIWYNSRGAADSRVLGASVALAAAAAAACGSDDPLDFEAHHSAEGAGLSVSSVSSSTAGTNTRRAFRSATPWGTEYRGAFARWRTRDWKAGIVGGGFRLSGAVRA
jgi:hypothetical protein